MNYLKLQYILFILVLIHSCKEHQHSENINYKELLILNNSNIDSTNYDLRKIKYNESNYVIAFNTAYNEKIYIFKNGQQVNQIGIVNLTGEVFEITLEELTQDTIPEILVYTNYDGGKFSQEKHIYIYHNITDSHYSNLIFSQLLFKEINSYNEDLEWKSKQVLINLEISTKNSIINLNGLLNNQFNYSKKYRWNKMYSKFLDKE